MSSIKLGADSGGGTVALKGPASTTSNAAVQLTLPVDDGTTGQYLKTDGSGVLSWATVDTSIADDAITTAKVADNAITNAKLADDAVGVAELSASGTASSSTFLRGDNSWQSAGAFTYNSTSETVYGLGTSGEDLTHASNQRNTLIGFAAGKEVTDGPGNTAVGAECLFKCTTGDYNTAVGHYSLATLTTGNHNIAIGNSAMSVGVTTGDNNAAIGSNSGNNLTSGNQNTCYGGKTGHNLTTGSNNTLIGYDCGYTVSTGSQAVCIGYRAGQNQISTTGDSLWIAKGANGAANGNVWIYGSDGGACTQGNNSSSWTTTSDQRLKKNIVDNNVGLSVIDNLKVRNFEYRTEAEIDRSAFPKVNTAKFTKDEADAGEGVEGEYKQTLALDHGGTQIGIIAQELEAVAPSCVTTDPLTGVKTVDTDEIMWHMLNAIKELSTKVKALEGG